MSYEIGQFIEQNLDHPDSLADKLRSGCQGLSSDSDFELNTEIKCFELLMSGGTLIPFFEGGAIKQTNISLLTDLETQYIYTRMSTTSRPYLKARYAHILYLKTKDNRRARFAADAYRELASENIAKADSEGINLWDFIQATECYVQLSFEVKYELDQCRQQLLGWHSLSGQALFYYQRVQYIFANSKLFNLVHLKGTTQAGIELLKRESNVQHEDYLQALLELAGKEKVDLKPIYALMAESQLLIASDHKDEHSGMVKNDCLRKASHFFKLAKDFARSNTLIKELQQQRSQVKLGKISHSMSAKHTKILDDSIKNIAGFMVNSYTNSVFFGIALNKRLLPDLSNFQPSKDEAFMDLMTVSVYDINGNARVLSDYEKKRRHHFNAFQHHFQLTIPFLFEKIVSAMKDQDRDLIKEGMTYFETSWFQAELNSFTFSEDPVPFRWLNMIKPALEILIGANLSKSPGLSALEQMAFDQLAVKFEGLLRDLCLIAGLTISKVRNDQTVEMDVNDLLQSDELAQCFDRKDLDIWLFTFTGSGYNIRNYVAHAFYRDRHYTKAMSNLLLVSYIRLAKYGGIIDKMKNAEGGPTNS